MSFILSLALIDSRNHYLRIANREPSAGSGGIIQSIRGFLHGVVFRRKEGGEGPYEYVKSPNAGASPGAVSPDGGVKGKEGKGKEEPWHWHTKQRKMMKREFDDAFEMRNSVAVGIVAVLLGCLLGIVGLVGWVWGFVVGRFGGGRV